MNTQKTLPLPPKAKKIYHDEIHHGDKRVDYYNWIKDRNDPDVLAYLKAENEYTNEIMKDAEKLQEKLYNEYLSRFKQDDVSVPYRFGQYIYYFKSIKGNNYRTYFRRNNKPDSEEELILDVNAIAESTNYCTAVIKPSPDNTILAYLVDTRGDYSNTVYFKDLRDGHLLHDKLICTGDVEWCNDSRTVYYTLCKEGSMYKKVFRHMPGKLQESDELIYETKNNKYYTSLRKSKSTDYIFIETGGFKGCEVFYLDAHKPDAKINMFSKPEDDILFNLEHNRDNFYIYTNFNAPNYRIMTSGIENTDKEFWKEYIPARENAKIEWFQMFKDFFVIHERDSGITKIKVVNLADNSFHYIRFPDEVYSVWFQDNYEFNSDCVRLVYTSLNTPWSYFDYDMKNRNLILLKETWVSDDFDKNNYTVKRIFAKSHDSKSIPVTLIFKNGMLKDGTNPLLLESYGSYGMSTELYFNPVTLSLLDRGFVYAIAHIRGGGELGEQWYNEGKLLNRKNTFSDFISCAEYLIEQKYSFKNGIAITGGSAGGTLMGAVVNMRPGLFKCVVALVPAVDELNFLFTPEFENSATHFDMVGDPNIKEYYFYIKSYTPYENISKQEYPHMLLTAGWNDVNVNYSAPVKFTAKLREYKTDNNILILKTFMESAHFGPSGRYNQYKKAAFENAFILKCFGINE
jgi:oligopeptidase B